MKNKALVLVHGILESSYQFRDFNLEEYDIYQIRLSGHVGRPQNFIKSNLAMWVSDVDKAILAIKDKYEEIYAVGHSMGGLLLLNFNYNHPNILKKVFCFGLPIRAKLTFRALWDASRIAMKLYSKKNSYLVEKAKYYCLDSSKNIFIYFGYIPRFLDLFKIIKIVRKNLDKLDIKIKVINSKKDEVVNYKITKYLNDNISYHLISKSGHAIYDDNERKYIIDELKKYLSEE